MSEDNSTRERVIAATMTRIAAAPPCAPPRAMVDVARWAKPALIAASLTIAASALWLSRRDTRPADDYLAAAIGVPPALVMYHATSAADAWPLLERPGVGR